MTRPALLLVLTLAVLAVAYRRKPRRADRQPAIDWREYERVDGV